jgi:hypothetical protein
MRIVPFASRRFVSRAGLLAALAISSPVLAQTGMTNHPNAGQAMGFDIDKTVHHFYLYEDGGAIDVSVKDKADKTNLDAIRMHLSHIAQMFGQGNFDMPMMVHETQTMPGLEDLAKMKDKITYRYAESVSGGRVDIVTTDKDALAAVHTFLKYQIKEHETGDKPDITKRK